MRHWPQLSLGGMRRDKGMPQFPNLPVDDLKAIQAFVINEAWTAFEAQHAKKQSAEVRQ